jgi:hypothetical protein
MAVQKSSTCVQTAQGILNGLGCPIVSAFDQTALTATGTITVATLTPGGGGITRGKIRIQTSAVNGATTLAVGAITCTDGTNTVQVGTTARISVTAAGTTFDFLTEFIVGIFATSFSFPVTLAGGTQAATINTEIFGTP